MIEVMHPKDLKVGMYVILEIAWWRHSFPKSQFKIVNKGQIQRIIATRTRKVKVDLSKSTVANSSTDDQTPSADGKERLRSTKSSPPDKSAKGQSQFSASASESDEQPAAGTDIAYQSESKLSVEWEDSGIDTVGEGKKKSADDGGSYEAEEKNEVEWEDSGIDTVSFGDKKDYVHGSIDTISLGEEKEYTDSGIDRVTLGEKKEYEDSGIDTVSLKDEKQYDDLGIDTISLGETKEYEDSGLDTISLKDQPEYDSSIDAVKVSDEKNSDFDGLISIDLESDIDGTSSDIDTISVAGSGGGQSLSLEQSPQLTTEFQQVHTIDIMANEMRVALENSHLEPRARANIVYMHSTKMMEHLLTQPNGENIGQLKTMAHDIAAVILSDDEVADLMLLFLPRDDQAFTHSANVGILSILLAKTAQIDNDDIGIVDLGTGFFLHDIGKTTISPDLWIKPGTLTEKDWKMIRSHPESGEKILADTNVWTEENSRILLQHHETEDGSGYPYGLSGSEISLPAQICKIADVYDALTSRSAYNNSPALRPFQALQAMKESMINQYNLEIFKVFVSLFSD